MILRDVKHYIQQHRRVSDLDIHNKFNVSIDAIEAMLIRLIRQGCVFEINANTCSEPSNKCQTCGHSKSKIYHWSDKKLQPLLIKLITQ